MLSPSYIILRIQILEGKRCHEVLEIGYLLMANLWIFNQFKGYNSCRTGQSGKTWLNQHICSKFHELPFSSYLVMANFMDLNQSKGNNSYTTKANLTKLDVH